MDLTVQIRELFKQQQGYCHWNNILRFYVQYEQDLTERQKKRIRNKAEKYRTEHNKANPKDEIRREDTNPNIYLSQIR